jgi:hypothetical protein
MGLNNLHSPSGQVSSAIEKLEHLRELGITASYGPPEGLKALVDATHTNRLRVH